MAEAWRGFKKDGHWDVDVNVRNFIQNNYTPYDGDESFLAGPTEATDKLWGRSAGAAEGRARAQGRRSGYARLRLYPV